MQINCKCCKDCAERQIGCHSTCENYKLFRIALDEQKEQKLQQKIKDEMASKHDWANKKYKRRTNR